MLSKMKTFGRITVKVGTLLTKIYEKVQGDKVDIGSSFLVKAAAITTRGSVIFMSLATLKPHGFWTLSRFCSLDLAPGC